LDLETGASNVVAADRSALVREQMLIALQGMAGVVHRVFPRSFDPTEVIVFAAPTGTTLNSHTERQLTQFVEEILQILAHLHHLAELEERERRLEIFIGHAKHSLSRPVGLILDRLRWITRANRTVEETRTRLSTMLLSAEDAARIIQRFTSRVRVAGKAQLRRQYHFVQAAPGYILEQTASQLRTTGRPRQIEFRGYDSLPQTTAVCDARALTELFENLIDNAVKYAQGGYPVFYEGRECNPETDEDWGLPSPGLRFVIKDFGLGIPEEDLERIFLPYVQSQVEDINRVIPGTGLGLAICRDIVQAHNGRIWAECDIPGPNRNLPSPVRYSGCWVKFIVELPNRPENQESV
jgi:signal transduction histidine kinase